MNSDARRFVVGFKVVESADFDTRVVPGGTVYVTTGMIAALDNEAELAFVLSHEIAHVAARHATQQLTKGQLTNFTNTPLVPAELLQIERQNAAEADFLGLQYLYKAGYDPNAAVIVATRAEMDSILPARAQNVLTTPEFDATKASLKK
jgi:predicted Zn-dependent protease